MRQTSRILLSLGLKRTPSSAVRRAALGTTMPAVDKAKCRPGPKVRCLWNIPRTDAPHGEHVRTVPSELRT